MNQSFDALGIRAALSRKLLEKGLSAPTPVQAAAIPHLLAGKDLMAQAQTGTGKTLAFVLPILERVRTDSETVQAMILTPTRELAIQITAEVKKLAPVVGAQVLAVYGGQDVEGQIRKLKSVPQVVIGTPGRVLDHIRRGTLDLSGIAMFVLDEADQMLDMGFLVEVEGILKQTPASRQTMLFSATISEPIRRLASSYMRNPEDVRIQGKKVTLEGIKQFVVETTDRQKQQTLFRLLGIYRPFLAVIFCRTKIRAKKLTEAMLANGFNVDELHGDLSQAKREHVMKRFRTADLQILVATDVAARGLDVEGVTHVFNYDMPLDAETYIHRIGRTGRAHQKGVAITLAAPKDRMYLQKIEQGISSPLNRRTMEEFGVDESGAAGFSDEAGDDGRRQKGKVRSQGQGGKAGARFGGGGAGKSGRTPTPAKAGRREGGRATGPADGRGKPGKPGKTGGTFAKAGRPGQDGRSGRGGGGTRTSPKTGGRRGR